jgi:glycerophosphodiester phosphodiesterase
MKFGKTLVNSQFPEWGRNYISYKTLKGMIKHATEDAITCKIKKKSNITR